MRLAFPRRMIRINSCKGFTVRSRFIFCDQLLRASISVPSNMPKAAGAPPHSNSVTPVIDPIPNPQPLIPRVSGAIWQAANGLVAALLAPACAVCDAILEEPLSGCVCRTCWSAVRLITPPVCDGCGDPLARESQSPIPHPQSLCGQCCDRERSIDRARAVGEYDGALAGHHPRAEIRQTAIAGTAPRRLDAIARKRTTRRGGTSRAGSASLAPRVPTRLQSGARAGASSRSAGHRRPHPNAPHSPAGRVGRRPPARERGGGLWHTTAPASKTAIDRGVQNCACG